MATVWGNFNNGDTGLVVRNSLNVFNTGIAGDMVNAESRLTTSEGRLTVNEADIDIAQADIIDHEARIVVNESDIAALDVRVTTNEIELSHLNDTGMTVMSGNAIAPQSIAITPTKINAFDSVVIDVGVGTSGDATLDRMTADSDGVFKLRFEGFVSYAGNVSIVWQIYKNGSPFGNSITLAGQGANAFPIVLISSAELLAADYLELFGTASAITNLTVSQSNGTLEKTHF